MRPFLHPHQPQFVLSDEVCQAGWCLKTLAVIPYHNLGAIAGEIHLHGNLGFTIWGEDDAAEDSNISYGAAVEYPMDGLSLTGEITGSNVEVGDDTPLELYAGIKYTASDVLDVTQEEVSASLTCHPNIGV